MAINFPNSPSNGDVFGNFTYDSSIPGWRKTPENSASLPAGTIVQWPGATAPANWLLADGSAISRTTYASLFAAIGVQYGSGDGTTTFNLPNLKGRVAVGLDSSQTEFNVLGEVGGAKTHTLTESEMPTHTHIQNSHNHTFSGTTDGGGSHEHQINVSGTQLRYLNTNAAQSTGLGGLAGIAGGADNLRATAVGNHTHTYSGTTSSTTATNQSTGGGGAHNNLQPYIVLNYIIKTSAGVTSGDSELATRLAAVENKFDTGQNDAPAGSITQFAGSTVPTNWLLCDGAAVSRSTWPSLFSAIGTTYGVGDGTTTFNLPDIPNGTGTGVIAQAVSTTNIAIANSSAVDLPNMSVSTSLKAGRTYRLGFTSSQMSATVTTARFQLIWNIGGSIYERQYFGNAVNSWGNAFTAEAFYTPSSDVTATIKLQGFVDVGSGTFNFYADTTSSKNVFTVEDMGESVSTASLRQKHIIKATAGVSTNDGTFVTRVGAVETSVNALQVADATTNKSGLVPIIPSSVSVNAGSASVSSSGVISFTGCVTLTINSVFSSLYSNYYVVCSAESTANATDIYYRLVEPSGTILSSYYGGRYSVNSSGVNGANWNSNIASAIVSRSNGAGGFALQSTIFNPYESKIKRILTSFFEPSTAGNQGFYSTSTASHTSLIIRSDQAMNTGTVTIYGMR